jgi:predicted metalloendopeptidase
MNTFLKKLLPVLLSSCALLFIEFSPLGNRQSQAQDTQTEMAVPRFSIANMDRTVDPGEDFYRYATGTWLKRNPVPPDKARWGGLDELKQRNWQLIHGILETSAANHSEPPHSPTREVGDFFASVMDTKRIEELGFKPLKPAFDRIAALNSTEEMLRLIATFQEAGVSAMFSTLVDNDYKNSSVYAFYLSQGGLGLPDRDYYLTVDRTEWWMTPQNGTGYFDPVQNEIVYAAGFLQPPFFDVTLDDAVNYGAIGVSIGHEITHGYDDAGRQHDADGNLNNWWAEADAKAFEGRAQKLVDQYGSYEALPGLKVNGRLTLGENIADLGGTSIAYEALERALAKDPSQRHNIDGITPEQRFFLSFAQILRTNWREAELRRHITIDPHSPGQFRAIGPLVNLPAFYDAFNIKEGAPMWRAPELRAKIW